MSVIDPNSWQSLRTVEVRDGKATVNNINELEIIKSDDETISGYVFANKLGENYIYMIKVESGEVVAKWNFAKLANINDKDVSFLSESVSYNFNSVLNGIAYYEPNDSFLISGKLWDYIFEVNINYRDYL